MNIEKEIKGLVEMLDDAFDGAFEEWSMNFTERQFNDFVGTHGATESTNFMFNAIEGAILEEALKRIRER
jgi:expansin (peptidoglycan-binding protein)